MHKYLVIFEKTNSNFSIYYQQNDIVTLCKGRLRGI